TTVAFDRDGHLLASGGADGIVRIWDARHRRGQPLRAFGGRAGPVRSLAFSADGGLIAVGGVSGIGVFKATEIEPLLFHRLRDAQMRNLAFDPDGNSVTAAIGTSILKIDLRSLGAHELLNDRRNAFRSLAAADHQLLLGREDGSILAWDCLADRQHDVYR